ncbi:LOB domain-containing protein 14-like isoform X1 [Prunus avium]|uniref:LOB domain-containing protein 14-like isoform X1 n=2 Tax=Prunus avium TaxID=42229 RepID=A0A6P5S5N9_PRUAV|nr:LOB domain-containing protein 14-like isoform X1 [Prunus avium]
MRIMRGKNHQHKTYIKPSQLKKIIKTMAGCGSPCGACKFLRRKCVTGCIFAPHFCYEEGDVDFSAIHKVFGASNVSRLLVHLPLSDRCKAAMSISYEAQARIQDPIYGCVSHIFALQQQVVNLQAQLAFLKDQAAQSFVNGSAVANPNQAAQSWFHELENSSNYMPQFNSTHINNPGTTSGNGMNTCHNSIQPTSYYENEIMNSNNSVNGGYENSIRQWDEYNRQWGFQDADELQSVVSSYIHHR